MANSSMAEPIRITKVGGRYLVFEVKDVVSLRRNHCICAVLVGTTPQAPTQNVFQGLPIELIAEEVKLLVDKKAAYIVDDAVAHLTRLSSIDESSRKAYVESLKIRRRIEHMVLQEELADKKKQGEKRRAQQKTKKSASRSASEDAENPTNIQASTVDENEQLFAQPAPGDNTASSALTTITTKIRHITATASIDMLDPTAHSVSIDTPRGYPLYAHLNSKGFYITPGIRFGGDYSVYPGDPFKFHAHFMATSYEWDEEITMLDLVSGGRLGTAVKKGFLIGGQAPAPPSTELEEDKDSQGEVRAFTLEWAAM